MFQFIKKIKLAFTEKQELLNEIEYLKKRNTIQKAIISNLRSISKITQEDEICNLLDKMSDKK